jgi:Stage II sporulation protein M
MTAWLLPHGVFEIPSILMAGQAEFYLARLLLHRREDRNIRQSMREWLVLVAGLAMMLVWAHPNKGQSSIIPQIEKLLTEQTSVILQAVDEKLFAQDKRIEDGFAAQDKRMEEKFIAQEIRILAAVDKRLAKTEERFAKSLDELTKTIDKFRSGSQT